MRWGIRKKYEYTDDDYKRDTRFYGKRGADKIRGRVQKGQRLGMARTKQYALANARSLAIAVGVTSMLTIARHPEILKAGAKYVSKVADRKIWNATVSNPNGQVVARYRDSGIIKDTIRRLNRGGM